MAHLRNRILSLIGFSVNSKIRLIISVPVSVTRFGDLLVFGQLFKAFGNN